MELSLQHACKMIEALTTIKGGFTDIDRTQSGFTVKVCRYIALEAIRRHGSADTDSLSRYKLDNVLRVTDRDLFTDGGSYIGDEATVTDLYCFVTDEKKQDYAAFIVEVDGRRYIPCTWSEGGSAPVGCVVCGKVAKTVLVPVELHDQAPYRKGESGFQRWVRVHVDNETMFAVCHEHEGSMELPG